MSRISTPRSFIVVIALLIIVGAAFTFWPRGQETSQIPNSGEIIPDNPTAPSPDRVITDVNGLQFIKDEVLVVLDLDTVDPEGRIREIATATGGVIVGAVPELVIYQIQYDVSDVDALDAIISQIEGRPDVKNAARSYLVVPL